MSFLSLLAVALFGAILGSFIGVVSERAYTGQSWQKGRSRCNSCREELRSRDLVPILSWIAHRGRCGYCGSRVPFLYVLYEALLATLFVLGYLAFGVSLSFVLYALFVTILLFIVIYDLRHTIVPLPAAGMLIAVSLLWSYLRASSLHEFFIVLAYAAGVALFFFLLYALSKGRAMGLGDTPVAFALSCFVGTQAIAGLLFSFWIGAVVGVGILVMRRGGPKMGIEVPFVPFLAFGYLLALFTQWNPLPF